MPTTVNYLRFWKKATTYSVPVSWILAEDLRFLGQKQRTVSAHSSSSTQSSSMETTSQLFKKQSISFWPMKENHSPSALEDLAIWTTLGTDWGQHSVPLGTHSTVTGKLEALKKRVWGKNYCWQPWRFFPHTLLIDEPIITFPSFHRIIQRGTGDTSKQSESYPRKGSLSIGRPHIL